MSKEYLERLDKEEEELAKEYIEWQLSEIATPEKIAGFRLPKTRSLIPELPCKMTATPIMALVPLYECTFLPVYPLFQPKKNEWRKITEIPIFQMRPGLTPSDLSTLAMKGRIIPYFVANFSDYDEKIIKPLIQSGIPRLSALQMSAFRSAHLPGVEHKEEWETIQSQAKKDHEIHYKGWDEVCVSYCIATSYQLGLREYMLKSKKFGIACLSTFAPAAHFLDAVIQTECPEAKKVLTCFGGLPLGVSLDYILEGLKVKYIPEMPLDVYADVFDGKTAKALRKIIGDLLSDPLASKYVQRLNAKIFDLNQQVEEIAEGKAAKVFEAVSDIAVYGGKKFIESKSHEYIKIPKKGLQRVAEWIASKGVDLQAKVSKKDWALAQLYKARCKLEKCK